MSPTEPTRSGPTPPSHPCPPRQDSPAGGRSDGWHVPMPEAGAETCPVRPQCRAPSSAVSPRPLGRLWLLSWPVRVAAPQWRPRSDGQGLSSLGVGCPALWGPGVGPTSGAGLTCTSHSPADSGGMWGWLCLPVCRTYLGGPLEPQGRCILLLAGAVAGTWGPAAPCSQVPALGVE